MSFLKRLFGLEPTTAPAQTPAPAPQTSAVAYQAPAYRPPRMPRDPSAPATSDYEARRPERLKLATPIVYPADCLTPGRRAAYTRRLIAAGIIGSDRPAPAPVAKPAPVTQAAPVEAVPAPLTLNQLTPAQIAWLAQMTQAAPATGKAPSDAQIAARAKFAEQARARSAAKAAPAIIPAAELVHAVAKAKAEIAPKGAAARFKQGSIVNMHFAADSPFGEGYRDCLVLRLDSETVTLFALTPMKSGLVSRAAFDASAKPSKTSTSGARSIFERNMKAAKGLNQGDVEIVNRLLAA